MFEYIRVFDFTDEIDKELKKLSWTWMLNLKEHVCQEFPPAKENYDTT